MSEINNIDLYHVWLDTKNVQNQSQNNEVLAVKSESQETQTAENTPATKAEISKQVLADINNVISNEDVLVSNLNKSKEISDNANEEKAMFLYNMTNDIRHATKEVDNIAKHEKTIVNNFNISVATDNVPGDISADNRLIAYRTSNYTIEIKDTLTNTSISHTDSTLSGRSVEISSIRFDYHYIKDEEMLPATLFLCKLSSYFNYRYWN